ncbi:hypothetical protein LCGC14_1149530 [marine sediment metagenome]|uniref:ATPase AAA-type core domain-containing protein n=1 Tax=marine sediment metagenome TaxID=412755 RepID=A0A0F9M0Y4_9ZZZZ
MERYIDLIDEHLRATFREMVTGQADWPLYIHGPVGAGKTRAALCLADLTISQVWTLDEVCGAIMQRRASDVFDLVESQPFVVLDEIGLRTGSATDLPLTALHRFLECREANNHSVGVYIGNVPPSDVANVFDDRIASRLLAGTQFELKGKDQRTAT